MESLACALVPRPALGLGPIRAAPEMVANFVMRDDGEPGRETVAGFFALKIGHMLGNRGKHVLHRVGRVFGRQARFAAPAVHHLPV